MIRLGDLPHRVHADLWQYLAASVEPCVAHLTAHTAESEDAYKCHKCGAMVKTYVVKPGSWHVWCLSCW